MRERSSKLNLDHPRRVVRDPLSMNLFIEAVESLSERTVHVEPPVTDEVLLVEQCPVRTEEAVLGQTSLAVIGTDMKWLTLSLHIGVVPAINLLTNPNLLIN